MNDLATAIEKCGVTVAEAAPRMAAFGDAMNEAWERLGLPKKINRRTLRQARRRVLEMRTFILR